LEQIEQALAKLGETRDQNGRNSLTNFILSRIHSRDQLALLMQETNEATQEDFNWKIQLKYHFVKHKLEIKHPSR